MSDEVKENTEKLCSFNVSFLASTDSNDTEYHVLITVKGYDKETGSLEQVKQQVAQHVFELFKKEEFFNCTCFGNPVLMRTASVSKVMITGVSYAD